MHTPSHIRAHAHAPYLPPIVSEAFPAVVGSLCAIERAQVNVVLGAKAAGAWVACVVRNTPSRWWRAKVGIVSLFTRGARASGGAQPAGRRPMFASVAPTPRGGSGMAGGFGAGMMDVAKEAEEAVTPSPASTSVELGSTDGAWAWRGVAGVGACGCPTQAALRTRAPWLHPHVTASAGGRGGLVSPVLAHARGSHTLAREPVKGWRACCALRCPRPTPGYPWAPPPPQHPPLPPPPWCTHLSSYWVCSGPAASRRTRAPGLGRGGVCTVAWLSVTPLCRAVGHHHLAPPGPRPSLPPLPPAPLRAPPPLRPYYLA
jgi:hypothetical protein